MHKFSQNLFREASNLSWLLVADESRSFELRFYTLFKN